MIALFNTAAFGMTLLFWIITLLIVGVINFLVAGYAGKRGYNFWLVFAACFVVSPLTVLIVVTLLGDRRPAS